MTENTEDKNRAAEERSQDTRRFVRQDRSATRREYTPEEKIRIVLEGFRREVTVNALCRREGIRPHCYYAWTKDPSASSGQDSWRPVGSGCPVTRCEMPLGRRSKISSGRTANSGSW